jgi:lysine/arginine/ornithine transport system substrate-binding protein
MNVLSRVVSAAFAMSAAAVVMFPINTLAADAATLRIGTDAAYPPYEYKLPDGRLAGLEIEIDNALCAAANLKCEFVVGSFDGLIAGLQSRKFDVIAAALAPTAARRAVMDFTQPVYPADIRLVAAKSAKLAPTAAALVGKRVGVLQGSTQANFAKANWAAHGVTIVEYQDQDSAYADLMTGRLDATLVLGPAAQAGFLSKPQGAGFAFAGDRIQDPAILGASSVIGVRKGDTKTLDTLNAALKKIHDDGTVDRLMRKYLGADAVTQ